MLPFSVPPRLFVCRQRAAGLVAVRGFVHAADADRELRRRQLAHPVQRFAVLTAADAIARGTDFSELARAYTRFDSTRLQRLGPAGEWAYCGERADALLARAARRRNGEVREVVEQLADGEQARYGSGAAHRLRLGPPPPPPPPAPAQDLPPSVSPPMPAILPLATAIFRAVPSQRRAG